MTHSTHHATLSKAAIISGIGLLVMVIAAPFSEMYVYPKLIIAGDATETVKNLIARRTLFVSGIFGYLVTFICDLIVAWALYIFLKPVNANLSLLTALFRVVYTVISLVALLNLVIVFRLLNKRELSKLFQPDQLTAQVMLLLGAFKAEWYFGLIFFGIHLCVLGYLITRSTYIPKFIGVLVIITGTGYLLTDLRPYLFSNISLDFAKYTFYGELVLMLWLLIKGWKIKHPVID